MECKDRQISSSRERFTIFSTGVKPGRLPTNDFRMRDLYGYLTLGNDVNHGCSYFLFHFPLCSFSWADSGRSRSTRQNVSLVSRAHVRRSKLARREGGGGDSFERRSRRRLPRPAPVPPPQEGKTCSGQALRSGQGRAPETAEPSVAYFKII